MAETAPTDDSGDKGRLPFGLRVPYTQVHVLLRRALENLQDLVVTLLMALLLGISIQEIWRIARMAFVLAAPITELLSEVLFVLILTELYRLLIFYLREHRVSVALTIEVALVSTLREVMLKGAHEFDPWRLAAISLLLLVLGGLLATDRWMRSRQREASEIDAS